MKILVFTEGTIIMHRNARNHRGEEIVKQVIDGEKSVKDYKSYIPIKKASEKLSKWKEQGAEMHLYAVLREQNWGGVSATNETV